MIRRKAGSRKPKNNAVAKESIVKCLQVSEENSASLEKLNILILGVDSMSQQNFARMLKKTSSWLQVLLHKVISICS